MKTRGHVGFATFAFALIVSCYGTDVIKPPEGPGTSYPCGIRGVVCARRMCCPENHICGFDGPGSRCSPGACCYDGDHWPSLRRDTLDGGAATTKQTPYDER